MLYKSDVASWTTVATADTTNLVDNSHHTVQGGNGTNMLKINRIKVAGLAAASAIQLLYGGRTSQVATGSLTGGGALAAVFPNSHALTAPPVGFTAAATNKPQRSSTLGKLVDLCLNAFGGLQEWCSDGRDEIYCLGNAASFGEFSISAFTGTTAGLISTCITLEPL